MTLEGFPFGSYEDFIDYYSTQNQSQSVFYYEDEKGQASLLMPCKVTYPYCPSGECAVVVQLDWGQITKMLRPVLAGKEVWQLLWTRTARSWPVRKTPAEAIV